MKYDDAELDRLFYKVAIIVVILIDWLLALTFFVLKLNGY